MPWITKEGRTVTEAQDAAVAEAGLQAEDLDIEIVSEGAKGLFGLGGEPAVVRVRPKDEAADVRHAFRDDITDQTTQPSQERADRHERRPEVQDAPDASTDTRSPSYERGERGEPSDRDGTSDEDEDDKVALSERQEQAATVGGEIVRGILERMGLEGEVNTRIAGGTVYVEIFGEEMGILIGRSGTTLEALQELVRAGVQRRLKTRQALVVDVEGYWERRRKPGQREGGDRRRDGGDKRRRNGNDRRGRGRGRGDRGRGAGAGEREVEPDGNRLPDAEIDQPEPDGNR